MRYLREIFDDWLTRAAALVFVLITVLVIFNMRSELPEEHPMFGVFAHGMIPILFIIGGVIFVFAILRSEISEQVPRRRHEKLLFLMFAGAVSIIMLVFGGFKLVEFTETTSFCGQLCHEVMYPEYTAYQASPHSRVSCAECHVGSGAEYLVKSKVSGIPMIMSVLTENYERPIPTPVRNLRPARETCQQCHWPEKFSGDLVRTHTSFAADEQNTRKVDVRVLRVGGGESGIARDIHWHIAARLWYLPLDEKRQEIGWVGVEDQGKLVEYTDPARAGEATPERIATEKRLMDCLDCHNRATHIFRSPQELVDEAMARGKIDNSLPFIKREAVKALVPPNPSLAEAINRVEGIRNFYRGNYPEVYDRQKQSVETAIAELREVARLTTFPEMRITWDSYPSNAGHQEAPGCLRCHGKLAKQDDLKRTISADCQPCHYFEIPVS
ncbi:MAG: NapC/NirT family cytochrome c [Chloroflexi bacterium]|nr:NapC/NirT family cytochrome c [Chloroflexota bacterium]